MKQAKKSTKDKNVSAEIISNVQNIFFIQMDFLFRTLIVSTNRNVFNCEQQKSNKEKMQFLRFLDYYPVHSQKYQLPSKLSNWLKYTKIRKIPPKILIPWPNILSELLSQKGIDSKDIWPFVGGFGNFGDNFCLVFYLFVRAFQTEA